MRLNEDTVIIGEKAILVPYKREHVDRYHEWMKSPELQELTASEPLSLEEEYEMQYSWANDDDKLTFIVLDRQAPPVPGVTDRFEAGMCGDVNLFLNDSEDRSCGEIEVMIAEPSSRGRGIGRESAELMMAYACRHLGVTRFVAKILEHNEPSLALFKKLGFAEVKRVPVFKEVHLEAAVDDQSREALEKKMGAATVGRYCGGTEGEE